MVRYVVVHFERIDLLGGHAIILLNQLLSLIGKYFIKKNLNVLNLVLDPRNGFIIQYLAIPD